MTTDLAERDAAVLYGATSIRGFIFTEDSRGKDCILLTFVEPDRPALHVEDLAVAYRNLTTSPRQRPGCTINPRPDTMQKLSRTAAAISAATSSSAVEGLLADWARIAGSPQDVVVYGVSPDTHFAKIMVDADYVMKSVTNGALTIKGISSLAQLSVDKARAEIAKTNKLAPTRMLSDRFWFNPGPPALYRTDNNGTVILGKCPVVLLTEEEAITPSGHLAGKARPDPLAKRFADEFTADYQDIALQKPLYRELEGLFRCVALVDLMLNAAPNAATRKIIDKFMQEIRVPRYSYSATVKGKYGLEKLETRRETLHGVLEIRLWMPSCGGVSVDVHPDLQAHRLADPQGVVPVLTRAVIAARPTSRTIYWPFPPEILLRLAN
jgi:hypothetical protein